MSGLQNIQYSDIYQIEDDSDQASDDSSEDERYPDTALQVTGMSRHAKLTKCSRDGDEESSEDEFEKEMSAELDRRMKHIESQQTSLDDNASGPCTDTTKKKENEQCYDNSYFDSDSDEEGTSTEKKNAVHPVPSNSELFYDPQMDDDDQNWVDYQRRSYLHRSRRAPPGCGQDKDINVKTRSLKLPQSDAVLNCPACMSLLTLDCQRHEKIHHQYRAMFVSNCTVDMSEMLRFPLIPQPKQRARKKQKVHSAAVQFPSESQNNQGPLVEQVTDPAKVVDMGDIDCTRNATYVKIGDVIDIARHQVSADFTKEGASSESALEVDSFAAESVMGDGSNKCEEEIYHAVRCSVCNTEVGVFDRDEVYHFFNVLSSYA